jgi:hypothetical protein
MLNIAGIHELEDGLMDGLGGQIEPEVVVLATAQKQNPGRR